MSIRCLTWQQPYASAVAAQVKKVENRPRCIVRVPAGGMWVGLHAGTTIYKALRPPAGFPYESDSEDNARFIDALEAFEKLWPECNTAHPFDFPELPRGVVLGAVHFAWDEPYPDGDDPGLWGAPRRKLLREDPWAFGKHCYFIDEVRLLPAPIPCRGMQGLWPAPPDVAAALEQLVAGGAR
jgi:hypothetical protein